LIITQEEIHRAADIIIKVLNEAENVYPDYKSNEAARFNLFPVGQEELDNIIAFRKNRGGNANANININVEAASHSINLDALNAGVDPIEKFKNLEGRVGHDTTLVEFLKDGSMKITEINNIFGHVKETVDETVEEGSKLI
jgi:hypothetical protein